MRDNETKCNGSVPWTADAVIGGLVVVIVGLAGSIKFFDLSTFVHSLESWALIPKPAIPVVGILVPSAELSVGGAFLFGLVGRWCASLACLILLAAFSGMYGAHLVLGKAPECACLGKLLAFKDAQSEATTVLARNGLLLIASMVSLAMARARRVGTPRQAGSSIE